MFNYSVINFSHSARIRSASSPFHIVTYPCRDSAFERRFLFKIKFDNPSFDAKRSIWSDKLPWMNETDVNTLAKEYDFSGGQIDNISRKISITEIIDGSKPNFNEIKEMCNN